MSMSVGASSSSALSYLQSLMQQGSAKETKKTAAADPLSMLMQAISGEAGQSTQTASATTAAKSSGGSACPAFNFDTMAALLAAQGEQPADSPSAKLFAKLDADGDGKISKTEFSDAASKAGADSSLADAVFAKIDGDSDGAISQGELTEADQGGHHRHIGHGPPPDGDGSSAVDGATTSSTSNADGSTTTTISYADGSKITLTTAAATTQGSDATSDGSADSASTGTGNKSAFNLLEQLIKLQSQMLTTAASTLSAVA